MTRDVLTGASPPASIEDWSYVGVSVLAGVIPFFWYSKVSRVRHAFGWHFLVARTPESPSE